jgi:predicted alternative tryptophan synthase beta-subunit
VTARLPFTQASVRRRIAAVKAAGLRVAGVAPDGTVLVRDGENDASAVPSTTGAPHSVRQTSKWEDVEA